MNTTAVAAIQMVLGHRLRRQPGARARYWMGEAARQGAALVVLPEYFCLMGAQGHRQAALSPSAPGDGDAPIQGVLADAAREHGLWILGGTLPMETDDAPAASSTPRWSIAPDG